MQEYLQQLRTLLETKLFTLAGTPVTVATLVTFLLILVGGWVISRLMQRAIAQAFRSRGVDDVGTIGVTSRLATYTLFVVVLAIGLQTIGVKLSALFAAGAVFAVAVGFAMQNVVQNFVSGVILLVERTIKPGDVLLVEGTLVKISKLGVRSTVATTRDEEDVIIPNSKLVQSSVRNYTLRDRLYRIRAEVGVTYDSDMKQVRQVLEEIAGRFARREQEKNPVVFLKQFGSSSVDWELSIWTRDPWDYYPIRCALNEDIWHGLQAAGIVIAFPQVDVHFDEEVEKSLSGLRSAA
jgi:small-conductance mechanosensitive channel